MEIGNVIEGGLNTLLGLNKDISKVRQGICRKCPIYSSKFGGICNGKLYLNPATEDVSTNPKPGYVKGCNCAIKYKTRSMNAKCPAGKW